MIKKVIILSAGQGSRLLPLTADRPKCLIEFSGRTLIAWQIHILAENGITDFHVVTGFMTDMVEAELKTLCTHGINITLHFNPFYKVADNLGSCWIVRDQMQSDFFILNGDTLISSEIAAKVQASSHWPITVTVDEKDSYDSDDMKVNRDGERLMMIGKALTAAQSNAESIGFLAFRAQGATLFREAVRQFMRTPAGVENWYLKVIDTLAPTGHVGTVSIKGSAWAEVDYLNDVESAAALCQLWHHKTSPV